MSEFLAIYSINEETFVRRFLADDFLHAVEQAEDAREEGEMLLSVQKPSNLE